MYTRFTVFGALALAAVAASPARALEVGLYQGTTTDGNNIQFTVSRDPSTLAYSITSASIGFSATCRNTTQTLNTGWGFGLSAPITSGVAQLNVVNDYYNFIGTVYFTGTTFHGNVTSRSPALSNAASPPTQSVYCMSAKKTFTGSYQAMTSDARTAGMNNFVFDRKGHVIGVIEPH